MKPILFNTPMVRAILSGNKTETRRLVKGQKGDDWIFIDLSEGATIVREDKWGDEHYKDVPGLWATFENCDEYASDDYPMVKSPYEVGDILYVRETWWQDPKRYIYRADYSKDSRFFTGAGKEVFVKWRPSIHMPKEAARIFLKVKDVRVERLQDIDVKGCYKEGVCSRGDSYKNHIWGRTMFAGVWEETIKPADIKRCGWNANPWVWVYAFENIKKDEEKTIWY